jgi:protein SDA1
VYGTRTALLTSNLPQLQNLIKRDPAGYREEFLQQLNHYESMRRLFELQPDEEGERFREVLGFIAQVRALPSFCPTGCLSCNRGK